MTNCKQQKTGRCQYVYSDLALITMPDNRLALPLRRQLWRLKGYLWCVSILGPRRFISWRFQSSGLRKHTNERREETTVAEEKIKNLDLRPGEWVEVRPLKEIFDTLDIQGKLRGLRFTPEMAMFCGRRFKVHKRLNKIILEATGELRGIKSATFLLEGVFCDGSAHGGCDRSCFCFWREEWLRRLPHQVTRSRS